MLKFLIIFCVNFKIYLRVIAHRTNLRSFYAYNNMTAVTALPNLDFTLFKNLFGFNVVKQCTVTFFVSFFYCSYHTELFSQFGKAFLFGSFCEIGIHICPFKIFALCRRNEIFCRCSDSV